MKQSTSAIAKPMAYKSVARVANILFCLSEGINTVTAISNYCKLDKSTVSRLLKALSESKLAVQDPGTSKYYLGNFITQIFSNPKTAHMDLVFQSIEEMKHLNEISEETVFLGVIVGIQYVRLNEITSKQSLKVSSIDSCELTGPQFAGSTAKVLLSQLDDETFRSAMRHFKGGYIGKEPVKNAEAFMRHIAQIRKQGYAISYGEGNLGIISITAPIKNYSFPAALSVIGPEIRLKPKIEGLVEELIERASVISDNLARNLPISRLND